MNPELAKMINDSNFAVDPENYLFVTVSAMPKPGSFRMVFQDAVETTVVCPESRLTELEVVAQNPKTYRLLRVNPSMPFYATGFTGAVTSAIGAANVNVVVLGTYSFDYVAVRQEQLEPAVAALEKLGLRQAQFTAQQEQAS